MLSAVLVTLFALMLISLFSGLYFLFHDDSKKQRLLTSLKLRIFLAFLLCSLTTYGLITGDIQAKAPWAQPSSNSHHVNENK